MRGTGSADSLYRGYLGITEINMETTIMGYIVVIWVVVKIMVPFRVKY